MKKQFKGTINIDVRDSKPDWTPYIAQKAPDGAPNVLLVLFDDTGLAAWSPFGGAIQMPTLQKLADNGLTYSQWHTTALCSPSRSVMLTGRNHHQNGFACITEGSTGFPGSNAHLPDSCATMGQVLQTNGWNTYWVGKNHNVPVDECNAGASKRNWPLNRGFDRFYGFLGGETNNWYPTLVEDNRSIEQPYLPEQGYHLSKDLADQALRMLRDSKATAPEKPWFMWFCPGANHAPHHVAQEWADKYKGKFDAGYEAYREWVLPRMIAKGLFPEGTDLTQINPMPDGTFPPADEVRPWDTLSNSEKKLFGRLAEVYAGFSEFTDAQIGRIVDYLDKTRQLDNTLILYCADNGASGEGSPNGSVNENKFFNGYPDDIKDNLALIDKLGGPDTYEHYPTGWAVGFSTPFKMFKRYSYAGGTCDPLVISWPAKIKAKGEVRNQYHHITDIVPTILDCCGVEFPDKFNGVDQVPLPGVSMRYTFDNREAPTQKERQYYCMLGTRGIWQDGWKAITVHGPLSGIGHFDNDRWELYHVDEDQSESKDLAKQNPEKLQQLIALWFEEAGKYDVLPLDDRTAVELLTVERPQPQKAHDKYIYMPGASGVPESIAADIRGRSFKILADVDMTSADAQGVIFSLGSRFGGHTMFVKDGKLTYIYNFLGIPPVQRFESKKLAPGRHVFGLEFTKEKAGEHGESIGTTQLYLDGDVVAEGPMRAQIAGFGLSGGNLTIGRSEGDGITTDYTSPFPFEGGRLLAVEINLGDDQYLDLEKEALAAFARE